MLPAAGRFCTDVYTDAERSYEKEDGVKTMAVIRKYIQFYGRVQGVGFRWKARSLAGSLGLTGWVKNEWDGSVRMEVQGSEVFDRQIFTVTKS